MPFTDHPQFQSAIRGIADGEYRRKRGALSDAVSGLSSDISRFSSMRNQHIRNVDDRGPERARLASSASSATAQQMGGPATSFSGGLAKTLAAAKARTGVMNRGEEAIKGQQLKDRLAIVRDGIAKRGRGIESLGRAANIREGVDVSAQAARDFTSASNANVAGGLAGMGAAWFANRNAGDGISWIPRNDG